MISFVMLLVSMSLQAVLIIGVVFGIRKLFALAHISKKYVMLLWVIPFFFLIFPWKITVPRGFWNSAAAELTAGLYGMEEADTKTAYLNADFNSGSQQGQNAGDFGFEKEQKLQELQNADGEDKLQESESMPDGGDISDERQGKSRHIAADLWGFWGNAFYFRYENEEYQFKTSCAVSNDQLEDIYITRNSDSKMCWLYTVDEDGERYPGDLEIYLRTKTSIDDWLTLELPEGYEIGPYNGNLGYIGGALIFPQVYQTQGETTFVPEHWEYAGFVGEVSAPQDIFVFDKGIPDERYFPHSNHSSEEPIGYMDTISAGLGWSTLMVHGFHDLYTAGDLGELELSGVDIRSIETQSEYWYFYFVKEGEEHAYFLSLSAKEFTETEAIDIARTVKITEDEAALQRKDTIQYALDVYFADFLHTLLGDSRKEYGREEFASIDGYIAGKWLTATREIYKNTYGKIRSAELKQVELLQLTEKEEQTEVLVNVSYTYAWGNSKEDTCKAGSLYRVVLKQEGDTWKVLDMECCNCKEVMILKNLMEKKASDLVDPYEFVDDYFEQMYRS